MTTHLLVIDDQPEEVAPLLDRLRKQFPEGGFEYELRENVEAGLKVLGSDDFDAILLDIKGVDDKRGREGTALPRIRAINPYIPVIMFSQLGTPWFILKYLDLGATTFIDKGVVPSLAGALDDQGREQNRVAFETLVARIQKVTKRYQPIKRILASSPPVNGTVRKYGPPRELDPQIRFLHEVAGVGGAGEFFPPVREAPEVGSKTEATYYEMPFYEMKNLQRFLLEAGDQEACVEVATRALTAVIDGPFRALTAQRRGPVPPEPFDPDELYFRPFKQRRDELWENLAAAGDAAAPVARDFGKLLDRDTLRAKSGGTPALITPDAVRERVRADTRLCAKLRPPFYSLTHGDLHFRNVLLDDRLPLRMTVRLIDPRGEAFGDPAYDVGKLLSGSHGLMFFAVDKLYGPHGGRWDIEWDDAAGAATVPAFEKAKDGWTRVGGGLSKSAVSVRRRPVADWVWGVCEKLTKCIRVQSGIVLDPNDPDWQVRAALYEAMQLCQNAPIHLDTDPEVGMTLYLKGAELLGAFWQQYGSGRETP